MLNLIKILAMINSFNVFLTYFLGLPSIFLIAISNKSVMFNLSNLTIAE